MSPLAYAVIHDYLARLEQGGATSEQTAEAGRLLVQSACNRLRRGDPRTRPIDVVLADIEATWGYVMAILSEEGKEG